MEPIFIGRFQLENLCANHLSFHFLWLEDYPHSEPLLGQAIQLSEGEFADWLSQTGPDSGVPFVLVCETGVRSLRIAEHLLAKGFINIFVLEQGLNGLTHQGGVEA